MRDHSQWDSNLHPLHLQYLKLIQKLSRGSKPRSKNSCIGTMRNTRWRSSITSNPTLITQAYHSSQHSLKVQSSFSRRDREANLRMVVVVLVLHRLPLLKSSMLRLRRSRSERKKNRLRMRRRNSRKRWSASPSSHNSIPVRKRLWRSRQRSTLHVKRENSPKRGKGISILILRARLNK